MTKKLLLFFLISLSVLSAPYKILHVSSYSREYSWVREIEEGIHQGFSSKKLDYDYSIFQMDTKRNSSKDSVLAAAKLAKEAVLSLDPDLIIVSDDNATRYVASEILDTKYNFVFCGVNNDPSEYDLPKKNITGVLERPHFKSSINLMKLINKNIKDIIILSDDSVTSNIIIPQILGLADKNINILGTFKTNSFSEWKYIVRRYQDKADAIFILTYSTIKQSDGKIVPEAEVMRWTTENSKLPEFGGWEFFVEDGGLMSVAINGHEQGRLAAEKAVEILRGKSPTEIPVEQTQNGDLYLNAKRAFELDLSIPLSILKMSKIIE